MTDVRDHVDTPVIDPALGNVSTGSLPAPIVNDPPPPRAEVERPDRMYTAAIFAVFVCTYLAWHVAGFSAPAVSMTLLALVSLATPTSVVRAKCMLFALGYAGVAVIGLLVLSYLLPPNWSDLAGAGGAVGFTMGLEDREQAPGMKQVLNWAGKASNGVTVVAAVLLMLALRLGATGEQTRSFIGNFGYANPAVVSLILTLGLGLVLGAALGADSWRRIEGTPSVTQ